MMLANSTGIFRIVHEPPVRLSLILGDFVHNVRSALDHLVWQLQLKTTETPNERSQFPIFTKPNAGRLKEWTIDVSDDARSVVESLQPYNRPNPHVAVEAHTLWQIGHLDGIDKHATTIVTVLREALIMEEPMPLGLPVGTLRTQQMLTNPLNDGDPVYWHTILAQRTSPFDVLNPKSRVYVEPTYGVVFNESTGYALTLTQLGQYPDFVESYVLPRFTRFFE